MLYHTTTTEFYYIMKYATLYFFLLKIPIFLRKMSRNYLRNPILQNEDEHKGKNFFVGIRHSLCPNWKISCLIQFNNMEHHIRNMVRCTNKEDRERKLPQPKVNTSNFTGVSFIFLWDVSWLLYYFGVYISFLYFSLYTS